jgi:predicted RNase H-like nuclease (RuvC/YqgF family)
MNNTLSIKETSSFTLQLIQEQLDGISRHMEGETQTKQAMIERQQSEIHLLRKQLSDKNHTTAELRQALHDCRQHAEGHQQLVNKLLNDISQYQNDLDWYKRTYEKRTFLGVIKEKLLRLK